MDRLRGAEAPEWARLEDLSRTRLLDTPSEERFDRITRLALRLFDVTAASVSLIAADRQYLKSFAGPLARESDRNETFCAEAIKSSRTLVVEDALTDVRFRDSLLVTGNPHIRFYAGHPLTGPGGAHIGTFCIIDKEPRKFGAEEQRILEDLTAIVQREMSLSWDIGHGARIQRALLAPAPAAPEGYSLATLYYPASGVSGDFYELGTTASGHVRITVGDAMGKGVGAGLVAEATRSAFANIGWASDPSGILNEVSGNIEETLARAGSFATAFHAVIDPQTGTGRYTDAGHGLSHILRTDSTLETLPATGPPLGLMPGQAWEAREFTLAPGDSILIPTDGLLDLHGGELSQLAEAIRKHLPGEQTETALKALCDRRGHGYAPDDITAVLLQRTP
jgi:serine phosphatase RsbU (regulator of sigma subunit)